MNTSTQRRQLHMGCGEALNGGVVESWKDTQERERKTKTPMQEPLLRMSNVKRK